MAACGKERSGGRTHTSVGYFKCGEFRHRVSVCKSTTTNFFKCGKPNHRTTDCRSNNLTCFNYAEHGHINTRCEKPKKAQYGGKVFALSGTETTASNNLI